MKPGGAAQTRRARHAGLTHLTFAFTAQLFRYEKAGFTLSRKEMRKRCSKDVVAKYWDLTL